MEDGIIYATYFEMFGYFDLKNVIKFQEKGNRVVIYLKNNVVPNILEKLKKSGIEFKIVDNFKKVKKELKKDKRYRIILSEVISDRSIMNDVC